MSGICFLFLSFGIFLFFIEISDILSKPYVQCTKTKIVKFCIIDNTEMGKHQTVRTQTLPQIFISSWFNYMWINFHVFIDHLSGYWSFYYLFSIYHLWANVLSTAISRTAAVSGTFHARLPPSQNLINIMSTIKNMRKGFYSSITVLQEI